MTIGSLFDGAGTCPLAGVITGFTPVWASEIEPFPISVTKKRFPEMKHLGDVTKINGAEIARYAGLVVPRHQTQRRSRVQNVGQRNGSAVCPICVRGHQRNDIKRRRKPWITSYFPAHSAAGERKSPSQTASTSFRATTADASQAR